jgi:phospholipase/carboxylesterase
MTSDRLRSAIRMETAAWSKGWIGATLVPGAYEPNYQYPLVVGLHGRGGNEMQAARWLQSVSDRNFVGFCPRGLVSLPQKGKYGWSVASESAESQPSLFHSMSTGEIFRSLVESEITDPIAAGEFAILDQIRQMQDELSVHPDRVFLMGVGEGASMAYRLALSFPDRFAGVISINGQLPRSLRYLSRFHESRRLKFLVLHGAWDEQLPLETVSQQVKEMKNAGLSVAFQSYPTDEKPVKPMFEAVNHWLMRQISSTIC